MKNLTDLQKENLRKWYDKLLKPGKLKKTKARLFMHDAANGSPCACFLGVACMVTNSLLEDGMFTCPQEGLPQKRYRSYDAPQEDWFRDNFGFNYRYIALPSKVRAAASACIKTFGKVNVAELNDNTDLKFKDMAEILAYNFPWLTEPSAKQ